MASILKSSVFAGMAGMTLMGHVSAASLASAAYEFLMLDEAPMTDIELTEARGGFRVGAMNFTFGVTITPVTPPTPPVIVAPAAPVIIAPTAPVIIAPIAPVIAAPAAPVIAAPTAPVIAAPAAPVIAAPTAPVIAAPFAPIIAAPAAPVISAPTAPTIAAPSGVVAPNIAAPVVAAPVAPAIIPATAPIIAAPTGPIVQLPTSPTAPVIAPPTAPEIVPPTAPIIAPPTAPITVLTPVSATPSGGPDDGQNADVAGVIGSAYLPTTSGVAAPVIVQTVLVPDTVGAAATPIAAATFTATTGIAIQTVAVNPASTAFVINNTTDGAVIQQNITIDVAISGFQELLTTATASAATARFIADAALLGSLN